jgi:hypothetical protein
MVKGHSLRQEKHKVQNGATRNLRAGLERRKSRAQTLGMGNKVETTDKELALAVVGQMRDEVSLADIVRELEFIVAVREGLSELNENNDSVVIEKFEPKAPAWTVTIGRKRRGRQKRKGGGAETKAGDSLKSPAPSPNA